MLEKPDLKDEKIIAGVGESYGQRIVQAAFLPLGADRDTAVYRLVADDGAPYFLKLRGRSFDEITVAVPKFLSDRGNIHIIAPLADKTGKLWSRLDPFTTILYPFIEGRNGYEVALSHRQWLEFGAALKRIHMARLPPDLASRIPVETYSPRWRDATRKFLAQVEVVRFDDPVAAKAAAFLKARQKEVLDLVGRAERYAQSLQARSLELVLCHADIHAGNLLMVASGAFYIVDWDNPIQAPKERDLMFIGGGQGFLGHTAHEEETLFYRGYGPAQVDPTALAYYRYERIIEDIAVICEQLLLTDAGGEDRAQAYQYLASNFQPGGTIEIAYQADKGK
jgi:spectinomycin phosphotransferase